MNDFWIDLTLILQSQTWLDWLDLMLVTGLFFILLTALQRTQATFMLRGLTVIALILVAVTLLLPLPAVSLLVRIFLLFLLVTVPIVFQRELRSLLERIGRSIGLTPRTRPDPEELMQPLVRAVEKMAADRIGALIVLEGDSDLNEIAQTGVPIGGAVSSELLGAIFYPNNPLHDGAALIRGETVIAAGCVLPIVMHNRGGRRQGTRHRAALGLSERSDALIVVVSEETGKISAAEEGQLHQLPDLSALRERVTRFGHRTVRVTKTEPWLGSLFDHDAGEFRPFFVRLAREVTSRLGLAALFGLIFWWFVLAGSSTLPDREIRNMPLQVNLPPGMAVVNELPVTVDLFVRTVEKVAPLLNEDAFVAELSLLDVPEGVHEQPVQVTSRIEAPVQIIRIEPALVPVIVAPIASRTLPVTVSIDDEAMLPAAYEVQGQPVVEPAAALVVGPQPLVEQVAEIRATLSLSNTRSPVAIMRPLVALDDQDNEVDGVFLQPEQVEVRLDIDRRADVSEVGVAIVTRNEPAAGFWVSGLTTDPTSVFLNGPPAVLTSIAGAIPTLPVDVSGAAGDLILDVPLDLPPEVTAATQTGESVNSVRVTVRISPRQGNLTLARPVQLVGLPATGEFSVTPDEVELLLTGPLATLQEIEQNPDLVRVVLEATDLAPGDSIEQRPQTIVPEGIRVQVIPSRITLTRR